MICPHCKRTIREEQVYMMSVRTPKGQPLEEWACRLRTISLWVLGFGLALLVFYLLSL